MIFNFTTNLPENPSDSMRVNIPIDIWEATKKKWVSKARITIGNKCCMCNIFVKDDGFYSFQYIAELQKTFGFNKMVDVQIELLTHLTIRESPYNIENPVRIIDNIEYVEQPNLNMCGQACVAMLTGIRVVDIHELMNEWMPITDKRYSISYGYFNYTLTYYGIKHSGKFKPIRNKSNLKLPEVCIVTLKNQTYGDYVVYFKGKFYDPEYGIGDYCYDGTIKAYWEIYS